MNRNQKNSSEGRDTLPLKESSPLKELNASLRNFAAGSFDNLQAAQHAAACGQHQYGGALPIVAHAVRVSPVVREVHL